MAKLNFHILYIITFSYIVAQGPRAGQKCCEAAAVGRSTRPASTAEIAGT